MSVWVCDIYTRASAISAAPAEVLRQRAVRGCLGNAVKDEAGTREAGGEDETVGVGERGGHGRDKSTEKDKVGSAHRRGESTGEEWEMEEDRAEGKNIKKDDWRGHEESDRGREGGQGGGCGFPS